MNANSPQLRELYGILTALMDGQPSEEQLARLEQLLSQDPAALDYYRKYMRICALLEFERSPTEQPRSSQLRIESPAMAEFLPTVATSDYSSSPATVLFPTASSGAVGYFASGWPMAYLVATVILGLGLVIGAVTRVSEPVSLVQHDLPSTVGRGAGGEGNWLPSTFGRGAGGEGNRLPSPSGRGAGGEGGERSGSPLRYVVGQITGMADCDFAAGSKTEVPRPRTVVSLGDKFNLRSGLLEITYNTGARVILQGPVAYEVESPASGFLSVGKVTARVGNTASQDLRPKTKAPNPKSPNLQISKFIVRTPTAVVTDLGTEFGVEVTRSGDTTSHVFCGSVQVQAMGTGADKLGGVIVVREGETVRTEKSGGQGNQHIAMRHVRINPQAFVRRMTRMPETLDLLDIVAGGNGLGRRRERGIDPGTGMEDPVFAREVRAADRTYRPVTWHKLIDGVFVPNGGAGPMVVDSAGHTFGGFAKTDGRLYGSIWARAANVKADGREKNDEYWVYALGRGEQYMPRNLGLLGMSANAGITFNLGAMRTIYPAVRPVRFRATAGVADAHGFLPPDVVQLADFWVLVDGQLKLSRSHLRPQDGPIEVDVELGPKDRFLTLVATDGGNTFMYDWVVFGDPVLEMVPAEDRKKTPTEATPNNKETP